MYPMRGYTTETEKTMGIQTDCHVVYGVQIERLDPDTYWGIADNGDQSEKVTEDVRLFTGGPYDNHDHFLVASSKEIKPGEPYLVPPYQASEPPYIDWDAALVKAAETIGAQPSSQPGWFFVPNEY